VGSKLNHKKEKQGRIKEPNDLMSDDMRRSRQRFQTKEASKKLEPKEGS